MSCYTCLTKFSFFTKEHSCPSCGFSFCSKCLKQKVSADGQDKIVCQNCFKKLTSVNSTKSDDAKQLDIETPDLLLKRLETLENPAKPPITIFRHSARLTNLKYGLSSEDKKILERLEKLKADHAVSALPDENEIKRRLALLQDKSVESISKPQKMEVPSKSHQEEVDELLKKFIDEAGIDTSVETSGSAKTEEIEGRLQKLQMSESTTSGSETLNINPSLQDLEDGDSETVKIIKRAIAEGQLQRKLKESMGKEEDSDISDIEDNEPEEELPWCIICNENAVLKCFGCDGSLYCNTCFKQGHEFFDMDDHKTVPFESKESVSDS